jgi:hypothetical protein
MKSGRFPGSKRREGKPSNSFANSIEGQRLWIIHKQGYRFAERVGDLTPLQQSFILRSIARDAEAERKAYEKESQPEPEISDKAKIREEMERTMRERREQLRCRSQQNS